VGIIDDYSRLQLVFPVHSKSKFEARQFAMNGKHAYLSVGQESNHFLFSDAKIKYGNYAVSVFEFIINCCIML
jgi:hypothetical protein